MSTGKTAIRSSRRRVYSPLPASRPKPVTYVPFQATRDQLTDHNHVLLSRRNLMPKHTPLSPPPRPPPSAPASKQRRTRTRRVSQPRQRQRRPASRRAPTPTSGIRSPRRWVAGGRRSRAWRRSGTRPYLCRPRPWASRPRPSLGWQLGWASI